MGFGFGLDVRRPTDEKSKGLYSTTLNTPEPSTCTSRTWAAAQVEAEAEAEAEAKAAAAVVAATN